MFHLESAKTPKKKEALVKLIWQPSYKKKAKVSLSYMEVLYFQMIIFTLFHDN